MPNQGKLFKTKVSSENNVTYLTYLGQKKPVAQNYLLIAISFYQNIVCDVGLTNSEVIVQIKKIKTIIYPNYH